MSRAAYLTKHILIADAVYDMAQTQRAYDRHQHGHEQVDEGKVRVYGLLDGGDQEAALEVLQWCDLDTVHASLAKVVELDGGMETNQASVKPDYPFGKIHLRLTSVTEKLGPMPISCMGCFVEIRAPVVAVDWVLIAFSSLICIGKNTIQGGGTQLYNGPLTGVHLGEEDIIQCSVLAVVAIRVAPAIVDGVFTGRTIVYLINRRKQYTHQK